MSEYPRRITSLRHVLRATAVHLRELNKYTECSNKTQAPATSVDISAMHAGFYTEFYTQNFTRLLNNKIYTSPPTSIEIHLKLEMRSVERRICPHRHVHNERTVPIIMARCIAHARNGCISTSGEKSEMTKLCRFNQDNPRFLCTSSAVFTGSVLVAVKRVSLLVMR